MSFSDFDISMMKRCIELSHKAAQQGEVPVGCVITQESKIIAEGYNLKESTLDPTSHAEILALRNASNKLNTWRLTECTMYVSLEPCIMCAGAIQQSRIKEVIFATPDPKGGGLESLYRIGDDIRLNHRFTVKSGLLADECSAILRTFFRNKRT